MAEADNKAVQSLAAMPDDAIRHIFSFMSSDDDFIAASFCSRRFYSLSMRPELQQAVASFSIRKFFSSYRCAILTRCLQI
jgi:hypothetical protein